MWDGDPKAKNKNDAGVALPKPFVARKPDVAREKANAWIDKAKAEGRVPLADIPDFVKPYVELINGEYVAIAANADVFPNDAAFPNSVDGRFLYRGDVNTSKSATDQEKADAWIAKAKQEGRWPPVDVPDFVLPYMAAIDHTGGPYRYNAGSDRAFPLSGGVYPSSENVRMARVDGTVPSDNGPFVRPVTHPADAALPYRHVETAQEKTVRQKAEQDALNSNKYKNPVETANDKALREQAERDRLNKNKK